MQVEDVKSRQMQGLKRNLSRMDLSDAGGGGGGTGHVKPALALVIPSPTASGGSPESTGCRSTSNYSAARRTKCHRRTASESCDFGNRTLVHGCDGPDIAFAAPSPLQQQYLDVDTIQHEELSNNWLLKSTVAVLAKENEALRVKLYERDLMVVTSQVK